MGVSPMLAIAAFSLASFGISGALPVFWNLPTAFLGSAAAAGGIAVINSVGNLSGFFGPFIMGELKDMTGSYSAGLLVIAACAVLGLVIVLALGHDRSLERTPAIGAGAAD